MGKFGVIKYTLPNNLTVLYKMDPKIKDRVLIYAKSPGGNSVIPLKDLPASLFIDKMSLFGLGNLNRMQYAKYTSTKKVKSSIYLTEHTERLQAACHKDSLGYLMKVIFAQFEHPRFDEAKLQEYKDAGLERLNQEKSLEELMQDDLKSLIVSGDERTVKVNEEFYNKVSIEDIERVYKTRIADASDWEFYITANIKHDILENYLKTYLANIKDIVRNDAPIIHTYDFPKGYNAKVFEYPTDKKEAVNILVYNRKVKYNNQERLSHAIIKSFVYRELTRIIREQEGGTYSITIEQQHEKEMNNQLMTSIQFLCDPDRAEDLKVKMAMVINSILQTGVSQIHFDETVTKIRQAILKDLKYKDDWMVDVEYALKGEKNVTSAKYKLKAINQLKLDDVNRVMTDYFNNADILDLTFKSSTVL